MGKDEFAYARAVAKNMDLLMTRILHRGNKANIPVSWNHISFLLAAFETILYVILGTDRATVSRVRDAESELLGPADETLRESVLRNRDRYAGDYYRFLLPELPFSESTLDQISNGRSNRPMVRLSEYITNWLHEQGYEIDQIFVLRRTMEFLCDPAAEH